MFHVKHFLQLWNKMDHLRPKFAEINILLYWSKIRSVMIIGLDQMVQLFRIYKFIVLRYERPGVILHTRYSDSY